MTINKISRRSFLFLGGATLAQGLTLTLPSYAQPVQVNKSQINGIPFYQTIVDLTDPKTLMTMGLAKNASFANTIQKTSGDEEFSKLMEYYNKKYLLLIVIHKASINLIRLAIRL